MRLLRRLPWLLVVLAFAALATVSAPPTGSAPPMLAAQPSGTVGTCDVDGVDVAYRTTYRSVPPLGYDVTDAIVSGVSWPSCQGAVLSVVLGDGATSDRALGQLTLANGNVVVGGPSATATVPVRLKTAPVAVPDAAWISSVGVTLDGGTTPIPPDCQGMNLPTVIIGTLGPDVINGTDPKGDLIYSLLGADRIDGRQGDDCITTGADANGDTVTVGNGNNVVRTGPGDDTVVAGNGTNRISTGDGNDTITVGNDKNSTIDAGPGNDVCRIPKSVKSITVISCETRVAT